MSIFVSRKVSKSCYTLWNQCSLCEITNSSRKWDSAPVRLRLSWLKYSQSFSTQLPFIHDLATVFGVWRHSLPLHSQIQPQETGHDTLASCASWTTGKGLDDLGSQWAPDVVGDTNVQGKLCSVALHHTLEISKQLSHVISETHGSLSSLTTSLERGEKWTMRANIFTLK